MSEPTIKELDEYLSDLVDWERFAIYLPGMDQKEISTIEKNNRDNDNDKQKFCLYKAWLRIYPSPTWNDVIQALEKVKENAIASKLRAKVQAAMSPKEPEVHEQVTSEKSVHVETRCVHVSLEGGIVDDLEELHVDFVLLTREVKREVESDQICLKDIVAHVEEQKAFNIELQSVQNTRQLFETINPHYNFLNCYLLVSLTHILSRDIACRANQYRDKTRWFLKEKEIHLCQKLEPHIQCFQSNDSVKVSMAVEKAWETHSMWLVKCLVQQLLHPSQCQWSERCMVITLSATMMHFIENSFMQTDHYCQKARACYNNVVICIALEEAWCDENLWQILVQALFPAKHLDEYQWSKVVSGSLLLTTLTSTSSVARDVHDTEKKEHFMRLIGVISLQVGSVNVLKEKENKLFNFENSLIQAIVENDIETVQFLLKKVRVNVNAQANQPIIKVTSDDLYKTESMAVMQLREFHSVFTLLMKDVEFELQSGIEAGTIGVQHLKKLTELPEQVKTLDEIFLTVKVFENFLNCHLIVSMAPLLSDCLVQRAKQYSNTIEAFKKETKVTYVHKQLRNFFQTEKYDSIEVIIALENAWFKCSMWFVDRLLRSIFSPIHLSVFQWFRVNTESLSVVFLAPETLKCSLIENSIEKLQLMKLTGVVSLQIGEFTAFQKKENEHCEYSLRKEILLAKSLGDKEALQLLLDIDRAPVATSRVWQIDENKNYIFYPDPDSTALMVACCNENIEMVRYLLVNNADPNLQNDRKYTALMYASRNSKIFQILMNHNAKINMTNLLNETVLYWACLVGNIAVVKMLLNNHSYLMKVEGSKGETPLHVASYNGDIQVVCQLLQASTDPDVQDSKGATPLYVASYRGHLCVVQRLLLAHAKLSIPTNDGTTPLHIASYKGHLEVVEQLLRAHADPNTPNDGGETPLHAASYIGCVEIVQRLLQANADPNISTSDGTTPLHTVSYYGYLQIVEQLLQAKADPNISTSDGTTPLHTASYSGNFPIVEQLLQAKADPNIPTNDGTTPLHTASYSGDIQVLKRLLQAKADPNIPSNDGTTPLHTASYCGNLPAVEQLLQAKADPNISTSDGATPLHAGSDQGHCLVVEQLLQAQADPNICNGKGETPLYIASCKGQFQIVQCLLQAHADPNIPTNIGVVPLHLASCSGYLPIVKQLLQAKADPNVHDKKGVTPLYLASYKGQFQVVQQLLQANADPNTPTKDGATPLHPSSFSGCLLVVEQLLQAHADPNFQDDNGKTPLYLASYMGQIEVVQQLLLAHADHNIPDEDARTPMDVAKTNGHHQCAELLFIAQNTY